MQGTIVRSPWIAR